MSKQDDYDKLVKDVSDAVGACGAPRHIQDEHTKDIASLKTTVSTTIPEWKKSLEKLETKLDDGLEKVQESLVELRSDITVLTTQRSALGYLVNLVVGIMGVIGGLSWERIAGWFKGHGG